MRLGQRLVGLLASLLLLAILVGLPLALLAVGPTVLPEGVPSPGELWTRVRTPDDGTLTLALVVLVGWVVWVYLAVTILLEIQARVRGGSAPSIPGLSLGQTAARGLVGAALLLFVAVPVGAGAVAAAPGPPGGAPPSSGHSVIDTSSPEWAAFVQAAADQEAKDRAEDDAKDARSVDAPATQAHEVAQGESLWSLAEHYLGDGDRYPEIAELNQAALGSDPGFLLPGTVLQVPVVEQPDAEGDADGEVTVQAGDTLSEIAEDELGDADRYPELFEANVGAEQPDGGRLSDPDLIRPGWVIDIPGAASAEQGDGPADGPSDGDRSSAQRSAEPDDAPKGAAPTPVTLPVSDTGDQG